MNNSPKNEGADQDLRTFLKHQHKRFYSACRIFANNYREHQRLFADIISAVSHSLRNNRSNEEKRTLLLRACVNMSALHTIALRMEPATDRSLQFKSPDYQKCMTKFRESVGAASEYDKILLFLGFEKASKEFVQDLTGLPQHKNKKEAVQESGRKSFIPYLKEKLVWS